MTPVKLLLKQTFYTADRSRRATRRYFYVSDGCQEVRLSDNEASVLLALAFNGRLTYSEAVEIFWPNPDDQPDEWWQEALRVLIFKFNKKLAAFGLSIKADPGRWRETLTLVPKMAGRRIIEKPPAEDLKARREARAIERAARNRAIMSARRAGHTYSSIAVQHDVSKTRVIQICAGGVNV